MKVFVRNLLLLVVTGLAVAAAPVQRDPNIDNIRFLIQNQESEIRILEEKVNNQNEVADELRIALSRIKNLDLSQIDKTSHTLADDIKRLRTHSNEIADRLNSQEERIAKIEQALEVTNRNIKDIQLGLKSIFDALQIKPPSDGGPVAYYEVRSGDSLDKIAKKFGTKANRLREINSLQNDRIFPGQKIKVPEK